MRYRHKLLGVKRNLSTVICGGALGLLIAMILNVADHGHWESPTYPSGGIYMTVTLVGFFLGSMIAILLMPGLSESQYWPRGKFSWALRGILFGLGFPFIYGGILPVISWVTAVRVSVFSTQEIINIGFNSLFQIPGSMIVNLFLGVPTALMSTPVFASLGWVVDRVNQSTNMRIVWTFNAAVVTLLALAITIVLTVVEAEKLATFGWR
jgi:MFS family permease